VLGGRGAKRFLLTDAQFVLAQEHGFESWAEFRAHIECRTTTGNRPVSRLTGIRATSYASVWRRMASMTSVIRARSVRWFSTLMRAT
jgi:hypothetical protein